MQKIKRAFSDYNKIRESGQMLLFVLIVVLLLLIILFAVVINVRIDIRETQLEREYEKGYTVAEEQLFKIASEGYEQTKQANADDACIEIIEDPYTGPLCPPASECDTGSWTCTANCCSQDPACADVCEVGSCFIDKRCLQNSITEMSINQDETLEVNLNGKRAGDFNDMLITWDGANAISLMVVYKAAGKYENERRAICRSGNNSCYGVGKFENYGSIFNPRLNFVTDLGIGSGRPTKLMRIRAIGADAINVTVIEDDLPPQMEEIRVQGFSSGLAGDIEAGLPGPELYTRKMINNRLPGLFDYVLFVAQGKVSKE